MIATEIESGNIAIVSSNEKEMSNITFLLQHNGYRMRKYLQVPGQLYKRTFSPETSDDIKRDRSL